MAVNALGRHKALTLRKIAAARKDKVLRHDAVPDDFLFAVNIFQKQVQCIDALNKALVQCLKLLRCNDTRQRVERKQPLLKRTVFVQAELDPISCQLVVDGLLMLYQLVHRFPLFLFWFSSASTALLCFPLTASLPCGYKARGGVTPLWATPPLAGFIIKTQNPLVNVSAKKLLPTFSSTPPDRYFQPQLFPRFHALRAAKPQRCLLYKHTSCENHPKCTRFEDSSFLSSAEILKNAEIFLDNTALLC